MAAAHGVIFANTDAQSVAWADINGDGWDDLWLAGHQMDSRFYRSRAVSQRPRPALLQRLARHGPGRL